MPAPSPEARTALQLVAAMQVELRDTRRTFLRALIAAIGLAGTALGVAGTVATVCFLH